MKTLEFYGGVNEIGGNKIKLNQDSTSLFLDFGMSFSKVNQYYSEFLQPRKSNGLNDFLELGLIPDIKGIYREDYLKHCGLNSQKEAAINGVLLSHAHADHASYINHLRKDIPIYMSENSKMILEVLEQTGVNTFNDILNYNVEYQYQAKKRGTGLSKPKKPQIPRETIVMKPYKNYEIANLNIQMGSVDHSLPGAGGYLIESKDEAIVYSGDLRFHGRNKDLTDKFVNKAKKFNPTIMLCEGTRIDSDSIETEEDIEEYVLKEIKDYNGLVIVNFPVRDLDRLITFYNIAKKTDRILVINLKQAVMLNLIQNTEDKNKYPKVNDKNIAIYLPHKGAGLITKDKYISNEGEWIIPDDDLIEKDYKLWEREFLDYSNAVNSKNIRENEKDYLFRCDFFELKELIDIKPKNGIYIHSVTEPFNEEMEIDFNKIMNWLNHFNIQYKHKHVSGHASGDKLISMLKEIHPEKLYPIHTEHSEMFDVLLDDGINVIHPKLD